MRQEATPHSRREAEVSLHENKMEIYMSVNALAEVGDADVASNFVVAASGVEDDGGFRDDPCKDDFLLGVSASSNCILPRHEQITDSGMCMRAATKEKSTVEPTRWIIQEPFWDKHPQGCFKQSVHLWPLV